ncbi:MAG: ribbon-helix-helix domain-containing protein [Candidatus Njordarchaeia archaeon]
MTMTLVTVHLPERFLREIEKLVEEGYYPNRSEVIRIALRDFLRQEALEKRKERALS